MLTSGTSLGSSGSPERSLDSDSELEDTARVPRQRPPLVSQESETSTDDDQLSPRVSMDLSGGVPETIPEQPPEHTETDSADTGSGERTTDGTHTDMVVSRPQTAEAEQDSAD